MADGAALTGRERRHLEALRLFVGGRGNDAIPVMKEILAEHPRDVLLMQRLYFLYFWQGRSADMLEITTEVLPALEDDGYALGYHAFALEENRRFDEALPLAERALARNPRDAWAVHAIAHVHYERGDNRRGIESLPPQIHPCDHLGYFRNHLLWHLALLHLAEGDYERGGRLFESVFGRIPITIASDLQDSVALAWRLDLFGHPDPKRWTQLAEAARRWIDMPLLLFHDLHVGMALSAAGRLGGRGGAPRAAARAREEVEERHARRRWWCRCWRASTPSRGATTRRAWPGSSRWTRAWWRWAAATPSARSSTTRSWPRPCAAGCASRRWPSSSAASPSAPTPVTSGNTRARDELGRSRAGDGEPHRRGALSHRDAAGRGGRVMARGALVIRRGTERDVPTILKLIRGLAEYERLAHEMEATAARVRAHGFGRRRYFETIICRRGGKPVGFALYFFTYSTFLARPTLYLEDLFVLPEDRGTGAGKALLRALARIAVRRGCGRLEWAVLDWNRPAIGFYKRLGAKLRRQWILTRLTGTPLRRLAR